MNITYNNQTIDFTMPNNHEIVISLSGGADSAALFYLACKHYPEKLYIPFTGLDENAPKDAEAALLITKFMKKKFKRLQIRNLSVFNFNDREYKYTTYKQVKKVRKRRFPEMNMRQVSKMVQLNKIGLEMYNSFPFSIEIDGMTANPSIEDMQNNNFGHFGEDRRNLDEEILTFRNNRWQPFVNVNKKFIADIYKKNKLLNNLFPMTRSCTGTAIETNNFTKECHKCFWCFERKWAFNLDWEED